MWISALFALILAPNSQASSSELKNLLNETLSSDLRNELRQLYLNDYDHKNGGWGSMDKSLQSNAIDFAFEDSSNPELVQLAQQTLFSSLALLDSRSGGMFSHSQGSVWTNPIPEKPIAAQLDAIRLFSLAYKVLGDLRFLKATESIEQYLIQSRTDPEGGFANANETAHISENAKAVTAFSIAYAMTGQIRFLNIAKQINRWLDKHEIKRKSNLTLMDSLEIAIGELSLYQVTADPIWLKKAQQSASFLGKRFNARDSGQVLTGFSLDSKSAPNPRENIAMARFANLLFHFTGNSSYRLLGNQAMRFLTQPKVARSFSSDTGAGLLLADYELTHLPLHITIVGKKDDPTAKELFLAAISFPVPYKRVEWWDSKEGPLPNPDVKYPKLAKPAAFICTGNRCSLPIFKSGEIPSKISTIVNPASRN